MQVQDNSEVFCQVWTAVDQWQYECSGIVPTVQPCNHDNITMETSKSNLDNVSLKGPSNKINTKLHWEKYKDHITARPYRINKEGRRLRSNSCIENSTHTSPFNFLEENIPAKEATHLDSNANLKLKLEKEVWNEKAYTAETKSQHDDIQHCYQAAPEHQGRKIKKVTYC